VVPRLSFGIEANPKADELNPLANWVAVTETTSRPAVMFGLSSDRIGTPDGEAWFFTLSKDLERRTGLPLAPYVGASYGTWDNDLRPIGGLRARLGHGFATTAIHDGKALHLAVEYAFLGRHAVSLLWIDVEDVGVSYSVAF